MFEKHGEYAAAAALEDDAKKTLTHLSELTQPNPSNRAENQSVHEDIKNLYFAFPKQPFEECAANISFTFETLISQFNCFRIE